MKKFSKLNESVKIDIGKVELLLSKLENCEYKIYDWYTSDTEKWNKTESKYHGKFFRFNSTPTFIDDLNYIEKGSKYAKIIVIDPDFNTTSVNIENYHEKLKFNSSDFYFINNILDYKKQIDQITNLVQNLKEYSASLCVKDNKFVIYLIGEELHESEFDVKSNMDKAFKLIAKKMGEREDRFKDVMYYVQTNRLTVELIGGNDLESNTIASLSYPLADKYSGYSWMKDEKLDDDLGDVVDDISALGFSIQLKDNNDDRYIVTLLEW